MEHGGRFFVQIKLEIDSRELTARIELPKKDPESFDWNYITVEELAKELVHPSKKYIYPHNMGIRMPYGSFSLKGVAGFHELLLGHHKT